MMNEEELKKAMKQHLTWEYKDSLHQLKVNRINLDARELERERIERNMREIYYLAFDLFGEDFANSLGELDQAKKEEEEE